METNRINHKLYKKDNKGLMKLLSFFGNPDHLFEEYMFEYDKEKREEEQRQLEERKLEEEEAKSKRKESIKKRRFSVESSSDSFMRGTNSQFSATDSHISSAKPIAPVGIKKFMKESRSEVTLMNRVEKAKDNAKIVRDIQTRQKHVREKGSQKPKPTQNKVFDMYERQLPSDTDEDFVSSTSSERESRFPPISTKARNKKKLYSDTKSKISGISNFKTPRTGKRKGRDTDDEKFLNSDGTMSLATLKRK